MNKVPTIRQLAAALGVSRTTVSLALSNHPRISLETRERVQRLAEKRGYRKDPLVSTLMNQLRTSRMKRTVEKLAYLTFWDTANGWRNNHNELSYFNGACERAHHLGYEVEHFWAKEPGITSTHLSKILYTRGIRGVVLAPLARSVGHVSLDWAKFSCAALSLTILRPHLHRASHNYHEGMMVALHNLKRKGYRRFGFANSRAYDQRVKHGWLSGFLTYQFQMRSKEPIPPFFVDEWNKEHQRTVEKATRDKFARWVERYKPDVVVSNTAHPLYLIREMGLRVPQDIGYASLHRLVETDPWAGIDRFPKRIGATGVDLVIAQLQNNEMGLPDHPKTVQIEGVWKDGPTVVQRVPQFISSAKLVRTGK